MFHGESMVCKCFDVVSTLRISSTGRDLDDRSETLDAASSASRFIAVMMSLELPSRATRMTLWITSTEGPQ